jgi:hypothetical protein
VVSKLLKNVEFKRDLWDSEHRLSQ